MSFCKELEAEKPRRVAPRRKWTLEDQVAAMDWDITGLKTETESLKRTRWWHRLFLAIVLLAVIAGKYGGQ